LQLTNQPAKKDPMGCKHLALLKQKMLYMPEDNVDETRGKMAKMSINK
jgi:hypothetical protein